MGTVPVKKGVNKGPVKAAAKPVAKPAAKPVAKPAAKAAPKPAAKPAAPAKMGLKELVAQVQAALPLVGHGTVSRIVEETFVAMTKAYADGTIVNIKDFGKLCIVDRAARVGRNPSTGEPVNIAAKRVPKFTIAKALKDMV